MTTAEPPRRRPIGSRAHLSLAVYFHARQRPWVLALVVVTLVGLVSSAGASLPRLFEDPTIPRPRMSLALGCVLGALLVLFTRPILVEAERLAAISMRGARLVLAGLVVVLLALASLLCLAMPSPGLAWRCLTVGGALAGIGLVAAQLGTFWGLILPSAYVMAGLGFGYQAELGVGWAIQPWAWLVDPTVPVGFELALLGLGLLALVLRRQAAADVA